MKNPFKYLYQKTDDALMYAANKTAHAWNWTTGRTKSDLANTLMIGGLSIMTASSWLISYDLGAVNTLINPLIALSFRKNNLSAANDEAKSAEKGCKSAEAERYKEMCRYLGGVCMSLDFLNAAGDLSKEHKDESSRLGNMIWDSGYFLFATSFYVMRTDYLPPRKSCIRRAMENLEKILTPEPSLGI